MIKKCTISVAMAIYNPNKYLLEQLESIKSQSIPPDEIIICDDSIHSNADIIKASLKDSNINFRYFKNRQRLNYVFNFQKALSKSTGDLVFISDQDDYWLPNKISEIYDQYVNHDFDICVHDAIPTNESLDPLGRQSLLCYALSRRNNDEDFIFGCCTVVTQRFLRIALPFSEHAGSLQGHDGSLHYVGSLLGRRKVIPSTLMKYRRHEGASSAQSFTNNSRTRSILESLLKVKNSNKSITVRLLAEQDYLRLLLKGRHLKMHEEKIFKGRLNLIERRILIRSQILPKKYMNVFFNYIKGYYENFYGWRSALMDLAS